MTHGSTRTHGSTHTHGSIAWFYAIKSRSKGTATNNGLKPPRFQKKIQRDAIHGAYCHDTPTVFSPPLAWEAKQVPLE